MKVKPATPEAIQLFMQGALALSKVEAKGILIDEARLKRSIYKIGNEVQQLEQELRDSDEYKIWKRRFGAKAKLGSHDQLEKVIFDDLGHKRTGRKTPGGSHSNDESAFEFVDIPFVKKYFRCEKLKKARGTYLLGMQRELCNSRIHSIIDLHVPTTYRSSVNRPNFQNMPIRNEEIGSIIRSCIIAPPGYQIGEIDLSGAEVCWSVNYHKDPKMKSYIENPKSDMHRDMAMQVYKLLRADDKYWKGLGKLVRYCAKNKLVFPEFYGNFFLDCSQSLWEAIDLMKLEAPNGVPLKKHLKANGIRKLGIAEGVKGQAVSGRIETKSGTFLDHVREVEKDMWDNRFQVYKQWKWDWWQKYCEKGWFRFLIGFVASGLMDRKQVCNGGIQGSAFHHLLWSLIQLQSWLEKHKMKSYIVMEIHDSILIYLWKTEVDEVLHKAWEIMIQDVRKHWPCIIVPITVEAEIAEQGESWFNKKKREIQI